MVAARWVVLVAILAACSQVLATGAQHARSNGHKTLALIALDSVTPSLTNPLEVQTKTINKPVTNQNLGRRTASSDPSLGDRYFYPEATWTNQSMIDTHFCPGLGSENLNSLGFYTFDGSILPEPLLMPDCFYDSTIEIGFVSLYNLIFMGSTTYPDPLVRLGMRGITLSAALIANSRFTGPNGEPYTPQWDQVFAALPAVYRLAIINTNLQGSLPTALPAALKTGFLLSSNRISGTIPPTLLSNLPATSIGFTLDLSNNLLDGEIPSTLFDSLPYSSLASLTIALDGNAFTGSLPRFSQAFAQLKTFKYTAANSSFTGGAQALLSSSGFTGGVLTSFYLDASQNTISGDFPTSVFASNYGLTTSFYLAMNNNQISGAMPTDLMSTFTSSLSSLKINFANNAISGSVPSDLLLFGTSGSIASVPEVKISLDHNKLTGALPPGLFSSINWASTSSFILSLDNNLLIGDLPTTLFAPSNPPAFRSLQLSMNDNPNLSGTIPASFLASINPTTPGSYLDEQSTIDLSFSRTGLTGTVTIPNFTPRKNVQPTSLSLGLANTNLHRIIIDANAGTILSSLDISGNSMLTGTLPAGLFSASSTLTTLLASHSSLGGALPDVSGATMSSLDLSSTYIDFCATTTTFSGPSDCNLNGTTASQCPQYYPTCATGAVDTTPSTTTTCPQATRPSIDYVCIGTSWTLYGNVETPTLVIPRGTGTAAVETIVIGNVGSATVVLGRGSSLTIQSGCASNLSEVTIQLESSDLDSIANNSTQTLISIDIDSTCTNLSAIMLNAVVNGKSCKRVSASPIESSSQLVALFSIDSSGCKNGKSSNTWWIIVVAVVVPVVALVLIIILLVALVRPIRECILPYSKRRHTGSSAVVSA